MIINTALEEEKVYTTNIFESYIRKEHWQARETLNKNLKEKISTLKFLYNKELDEKVFRKIKTEEQYVRNCLHYQQSTELYIEALEKEITTMRDKLIQYYRSNEYWHKEYRQQLDFNIELMERLLKKPNDK